jgi:MFS family permease
MLVWGCSLVGRAAGGGVHYKTVIPARRRYIVALVVYVLNALNEGFYLFFPIPVMMVLCFLIGLGGVTSYTIRISATQSYVPDEKKGRFNGAFNMLFMVGALIGELIGGVGTQVISERMVLMIAMIFNAVMAVVIIGGCKDSVSYIYNREN